MNKLVFRFDIDTHKCIRDGAPNLVNLSNIHHVPFTFFLNLGKAVSVKETVKNSLNKKCGEAIERMSAREKLGNRDYLYAALINPNLFHYRKQISGLLKSNCETGIHGGKNHALWGEYADTWNAEQVENEIGWSISMLQKIEPFYQPAGFASPEWRTPKELEKVLLKYHFKYYSDRRCSRDDMCIVDESGNIPNVGVNMTGEPGGVAFFENCRVKGMQTAQIISTVINHAKEHPVTILYDHPYYAGTKELDTIESMIQEAKTEGIEIVTLASII